MDGSSLEEPIASGQDHKPLELKEYSLPDLSDKVTKASSVYAVLMRHAFLILLTLEA